ncbi:bifunctional riboflavin kinase/FAD synthetase [Microlunatus panaciterrae]|uniref:Riboflavin biosynthesis protein n=1 Tax=Microlunatus panaciterrae TaxID=400768 RepID=A0ABS2RMU0_9ACTN|nr:bifunctional riboflavin kinase/FAD synthetase [Microlunatus panaciterrae]MBM7800330.1 riboflavin kinase/FMN adenylyltransferase [Microlunatus panaciterrae]
MTSEAPAAPSVVIIGNFDGVHRGHVELAHTAARSEPNTRLVAVTFWPHPMSVIRPDRAPLLLTSLPRRKELLHSVGVDEVVVVDFTPEVANWSPEKFVDEIIRPLNPVRIVVGQNFRFGFRAAGTVQTLNELSHGQWTVQALPLLTDGTVPSSSTLIRHAVAEGDFGRVRELTDHVFRYSGVVVKGAQRGREMGFPTANVDVEPGMAVPEDGVYAGWVTRQDSADAERWPAAISVGSNPTFAGESRRIEAYVLDRDDLELYGVPIAIDFYLRLRGQVKYEGMPALVRQMRLDVEQARHLLAGLEEH